MNNKPNILFIYPDQMRYDAMSNTGNTGLCTPHIDRLSDEGVNFRKAYTSYPLCCPFRASVMTGKYAHNHGLYANHYPIPTNQEFLPEILNDNGYATGWIGKWHLNGGRKQDFVEKELRCGFETFIGFSRGHSYRDSVFYRDDDRTPRKSKDFEPVYQTRHLFEFIDSVGEEKPFFAGICYGMPHPPLVAPKEYLNMYNPADVTISPNVPAYMEQEAREFTAKYYGLTKMVDDEVGKVLEGLKDRGILEDTIIIFASDHGEMAGEYGVYQKRYIKESSMHVPFIIRYPKKFNHSNIDNLVDPSVDIFPTILDACGIDIPKYAEGISLIGQCESRDDATRKDFVYFENMRQPFIELDDFFGAFRGLRTRDYCYLESEGIPVELFILDEDPLEQNNVIKEEKYRGIVNELHEKLEGEMKNTGDSWNIQYSKMIEDYESHSASVAWTKKLYSEAVLDDE